MKMLFTCILSTMDATLKDVLLEFFGMMKGYNSFNVVYMSELLWCWQKGNKQIYTRNFAVAKQAIDEGFFVKVLRGKPHIIKK